MGNRTSKRQLPVPTKRTLVIMAWTGGVFAALLILGMLVAIVGLTTDYANLEDKAEASKADQRALSKELAAQDQSLAEANRRLRELGEKPVPAPPVSGNEGPVVIVGSPGPAGDDGEDGARGPRGLRGLRGFTGLPGLPGIDGTDGTDGTDGADGADGEDAFPFTFVFTIPGNGINEGQTYTCRIADSGPITCQESQ